MWFGLPLAAGSLRRVDFKKLGRQVGELRKQAEEKLGDRAEPENIKRDGKELRGILSGDGSLAEKAREAKEKLSDPERPSGPGASGGGDNTGGQRPG